MKLQPDKRACILAALMDAEALDLRSISLKERAVVSLGEQVDEALHINAYNWNIRVDILVFKEYLWLSGKTHQRHSGSDWENK